MQDWNITNLSNIALVKRPSPTCIIGWVWVAKKDIIYICNLYDGDLIHYWPTIIIELYRQSDFSIQAIESYYLRNTSSPCSRLCIVMYNTWPHIFFNILFREDFVNCQHNLCHVIRKRVTLSKVITFVAFVKTLTTCVQTTGLYQNCQNSHNFKMSLPLYRFTKINAFKWIQTWLVLH